MNKRIDQFCEDLRIKLTSIDNSMKSLKAKIEGKARTAKQEVQTHLDDIKKRIDQDRTKVAAAQVNIKKWGEEGKAVTSARLAEWKTKREMAELQSRADNAERYAAAAAVVALAATEEAEQASLEAWLARADADSANSTKAA
jgi:hypothetical protein